MDRKRKQTDDKAERPTRRETRQDRLALARDAGFSRFSLMGILAGVLVGYGAFAVLVGVIAGAVTAAGADVDTSTISGATWDDLSITGTAVVGVALFLAWLGAGYVAGRMARRSGLVNGLATFVVGLVLAGGAAALVALLADDATLRSNLESLGVPASGQRWGDVATVAGIVSLAAMLIGCLLGGMLGERWHAKLISRALDPGYGREAAARQQAEADLADAERKRQSAADHSQQAARMHTEATERAAQAAPQMAGRGLGSDSGTGATRSEAPTPMPSAPHPQDPGLPSRSAAPHADGRPAASPRDPR